MTLDHGIGFESLLPSHSYFSSFPLEIRHFPTNRQTENLKQLVAILVILCDISVTWGEACFPSIDSAVLSVILSFQDVSWWKLHKIVGDLLRISKPNSYIFIKLICDPIKEEILFRIRPKLRRVNGEKRDN